MKNNTHSVKVSKWIVLCSALLLCTGLAFGGSLESMGFSYGNHVPSQTEREDRHYADQISRGLSSAGWRVINNTTNRVNARWSYFSGEVLLVVKGGVIVTGSYGGPAVFSGEFFVENYPKPLAEGDQIGKDYFPYAMLDGTREFNGRTFHKLNYGQVWTPPPPKPLTAEQVAVSKAAVEQKKKASLAAALKYNQDQAAKGDELGLLRMGERYRDGEGVEKDLVKAREYFERAAKLQNSTALAALQKLPPP